MKITTEERDAVYKTIFNRRDVRGEFKPDCIPDDVLQRILNAAHHAPSVGFMQPWDFVVVKDPLVKKQIKEGFEVAHSEAAEMFEGDRQTTYKRLKLEGILESPIGICITCDQERTGPVVIGRTENKRNGFVQCCMRGTEPVVGCRAENLGVGWVSIINHQTLRDALGIPKNIIPIAYLCVGYVSEFHEKPELEKAGWLPRLDLETLVHYDQWDGNSQIMAANTTKK